MPVEMRHRFHSLCPYFAMFPEQFAEKWIDRLTNPGDYVLDPFAGRGTTALSSLLRGRKAISCDTNDVAVCLTRAKTTPPAFAVLNKRIEELQRQFTQKSGKAPHCLPPFFESAFSRGTLEQLVFLRAALEWKSSKVDAMVAALVLGSLHGESQKCSYYLSNQMPRTISTKPAYSIRFWARRRMQPPDRNVFRVLQDRAQYRYTSKPPKGISVVFHSDMRNLPRLIDRSKTSIKCVITSPPYLDVTNFEEDQWLRLWFLGGPAMPTASARSRDDRHLTCDKYWTFISDMWRALGATVAANAHLVIRIGSRKQPPLALRSCLSSTSALSGRKVKLVSTHTTEIRNSQTRVFRPNSRGCSIETDCHFVMT